MKEITPKGLQRLPAYKSKPWESIVSIYRGHEGYTPILRVVEKLAASSIAAELFPHTSMMTLCLTDTENFRRGENIVSLKYDCDTSEFHLEHHTFSGKNDKKICKENDVLQTLSLFLKYKFGILFNPEQIAS